jgi:hypothetical protein
MSTEQDVVALRKKIEKLLSSGSGSDVSEDAAALLAALAAIADIDEELLRRTKIAFTVDSLRKSSLLDEVGKRAAKDLLKGWQKLASSSSSSNSKTNKEKKKKQSGEKKTSSTGKGSDGFVRDSPIDFQLTAPLPKRNKHGKLSSRVVDPDSVTLWIRIRLGNPDLGARKLRNFSGKMHFLVFFYNKISLIKKYKIALTTF